MSPDDPVAYRLLMPGRFLGQTSEAPYVGGLAPSSPLPGGTLGGLLRLALRAATSPLLAHRKPLPMPATSNLETPMAAHPPADEGPQLMLRQQGAEATPLDSWLTPEEAAEATGRSPATLKAWRSKGRGPDFFRYGASGVRYRASAIRAWQANRRSP